MLLGSSSVLAQARDQQNGPGDAEETVVVTHLQAVASALQVYDYEGAVTHATAAVESAKNLAPGTIYAARAWKLLAVVRLRRGEPELAKPALDTARTLYDQLSPEYESEKADLLNTEGTWYYRARDFRRAAQSYEAAFTVLQRLPDASPFDLARVLTSLGTVYGVLQQYDLAQDRLDHALHLQQQVPGGAEHPETIATLYNRALLAQAKGDIGQAINLLKQSTTLQERELALFLATKTEGQSREYLTTIAADIDATVSLHIHGAPADPEALRLALTTLLSRKGRALDAMTNTMAMLRRHLTPEAATLLEQLATTRARLTAARFSTTGRLGTSARKEMAQLVEQTRLLTQQLSALSGTFRSHLQPVNVETVQQIIPADSVLVEFVEYHPFRPEAETPQRWGRRHYAAYILSSDRPPDWINLGETEPIDRLVRVFVRAVRRPDRAIGDVMDAARNLDAKLMQPIRQKLGERYTVLLAPDGPLHLLPFEALVDENGQYLIENYTFIYLTSGRDLLRFQQSATPRQQPVIVANPTFDSTSQRQLAHKAWSFSSLGLSRSANFSRQRFESSPGFLAEATAIQHLLPDARLLLGAQATKTALQTVRGPRVLHLVTHGFFLGERPAAVLSYAHHQPLRSPEEQRFDDLLSGDNPLLRSGVALAGANQVHNGSGEGILTALEAAGLDLWGTQLVVLSACETGVGEVQDREGVQGLRRAFVIAGADSVVMSLWKIDDQATTDLMVNYYQRLLNGSGRAEGLRRTRLAMLHGTDSWDPWRYWKNLLGQLLLGEERREAFRQMRLTWQRGTGWWRHPYYWAGFIVSGNGAPVDGL